jgi:hypothetical protein
MRAVRTLLQLLIAGFFLLVAVGFLASPINSVEVVNLVGILVFFLLLFVATFSIGKQKENRLVLGYKVNPKVFGLMMLLLGVFMFFASWRIMSGQPLGRWPEGFWGIRRGIDLSEFVQSHGPGIPAAILIALGVGACLYGFRLFRGR